MRPLRILVAESDAVVAEDLRRTLEEMGHEVPAVVHSGDDAAAEARGHAVELALLDVRMPGAADGIEAGRQLVHDLDIPVVFVSAYHDDDTRRRAWQAHPLGYIVKPVDPRQLRAVIELAARRHARERRMREHMDELGHLALYDPLTGLPNRTLFKDRLGQSLERGRRENREVVVLFVDLDGFKVVNDTLGHAAGDRVLELAAKRLKSCFRDEDTVARLGGDEFAVVVVDREAESAGAEATAERVRVALERPIDVGGVELHLQASVGIAIAPRHASSVLDLLRFSDAAMYEAKGSGGGTHRMFDPERAPDPAKGRVGDELAEALERGRFVLHYQPVASLETAAVVGAEALVRWDHPRRGLIPPSTFLPAVEEQELTVPLGRHVLALLADQLAEWGDNELPPGFFVSVNLSPRHVGHPGVAGEITRLLASRHVDPTRLVVEVAEGAVLLAPGHLEALRRQGVRVALDDYGTGRAHLTHLGGLRLDMLKLDHTMVARIDRSWTDFVIARSVILCGEGLGLEVVAEGVESKEQADALVELGCPLAQGHLFSEPIGPDQLRTLLSFPTRGAESGGD